MEVVAGERDRRGVEKQGAEGGWRSLGGRGRNLEQRCSGSKVVSKERNPASGFDRRWKPTLYLWGRMGWVGEAGAICSRPTQAGRPQPCCACTVSCARLCKAKASPTLARFVRGRRISVSRSVHPCLSVPRRVPAPAEASYSRSRCRLCGSACCLLPLPVDRPRGHVPRQRVVDPLLLWIALLDRWCVTARQAERRRGKYMVLVYNETRSAAAGGLSSDGSTSERAAGVDRPTAEMKMRAHTIPYPESCYCYGL
jgi:hypothetical protein